jgi:hypothetical protein
MPAVVPVLALSDSQYLRVLPELVLVGRMSDSLILSSDALRSLKDASESGWFCIHTVVQWHTASVFIK